MNRGNLYIVSAPSGAGKSSLIQAVLQRNTEQPLGVSISHTTRQQRPGEIEAINYYFIDVTTFELMIERQEFIEYAKVFGHYYGTSYREIEQRLAQGLDIFLDIDWQGARQVRKIFKDCRSIFILPPSQEALQQRLISRKQDTTTVIQERMRQAVAEISHYNEYDYIIINDNFEQAIHDIQAIIRSERLKQKHQVSHHQQLIAELLR